MQKSLLFMVLLSAISPLSVRAATSTVVEIPPEPAVVNIGTYVIDIRDLDLQRQRFQADFYLWMRFKTPIDPHFTELLLEGLEVVNGTIESRQLNDFEQVGDETYVSYRMFGDFYFKAEMHRYPFDSQKLVLIFENQTLDAQSLVFKVDTESYQRSRVPSSHWGIDDAIHIPEFTLVGVNQFEGNRVYQTDFGYKFSSSPETQFSQYTVTADYARDYRSFLFKIIIPLILIILIGYLAIWLPPGEGYGLGITALLTAVAFNIAVGSTMPMIGYLVVSDKFFFATFTLLFLAVAERVAYTALVAGGQFKKSAHIAKWAKILYPIFALLIMSYFVIQGVISELPVTNHRP